MFTQTALVCPARTSDGVTESVDNLTLTHLTCVTPRVDLETTGFVVDLATARVRAGEVTCFSEVSAIVGEEGTEGDESFFTACTGQRGN